MTAELTYTPAAYWHRLGDEILEPRQTVTVRTLPEPQHGPSRELRRDPSHSRYRTDPAFRERQKAYQRAYQKKKREQRQQQQSVNRDWRGVPFPETVR